MGRALCIRFSNCELRAELLDTPTAGRVWEALPFSARASLWGEEVYFRIPVSLELEPEAREVVERGEIGYWPTGEAMAIFFGPTPVSRGDECRAASPVNVFARLAGPLEPLRDVAEGDAVEVSRETPATGKGR